MMQHLRSGEPAGEYFLRPEETSEIYLAGGFAHPELNKKIAAELGTELGPLVQKVHPNGEIYARYEDSVRGKRVFVMQPHIRASGTSVQDAIMEQCLLADAARSSSAQEITAVSPYLAYMRQDRKTRGREPIGSRVLIDQLASAGFNRIVTVDMHAAQAEALFRGPFDHLTAQPLLRRAMAQEIGAYDRDECVVVAPDAGAAKLSDRHRRELGTALIHLTKMRDANDNQKIKRDKHVPEADGRVCLIFDDMVDTAGTLVSAAEVLKNSGAKAVYAAATHGILSDPAIERIQGSQIDKLLVTDTYTTDVAQYELGSVLRVVSVAPMIAHALKEVIRYGSISEIFNDQNHM